MVLQLSPGTLTVVFLATIVPAPASSRALPSLTSRGSGLTSTVRVGNFGAASQEKREIDLLHRVIIGEYGGKQQISTARPKHGLKGPWGIVVARRLRGGAARGSAGRGGEVDEEEAEEEREDEEGEEDSDAFGDEDDNMMDEEEFGEESWLGRTRQAWVKTPLITRSFFKVSISLGLGFMFLNNNQWPSVLMLDWQRAVYGLQLWRLITPFFFMGPVGLNFFLTAQFMWTYMSQLERLHYREPHTFVMLLAFGVASLLLLSLLTGADGGMSHTLGHSLTCFLIMVWSRKYAGTKVNVLDMFDIPTELLPYFFVLQSLMMDGIIPWVDLTGLMIGYFWQTLHVKGFLKAPKPLVNLFRRNPYLRAEYDRAGKEFGVEIPPLDLDGDGVADDGEDDSDDLPKDLDETADDGEQERFEDDGHGDDDELSASEETSGKVPGAEKRTGGYPRGRGSVARVAATGGGGRASGPEAASEDSEEEEDEEEDEADDAGQEGEPREVEEDGEDNSGGNVPDAGSSRRPEGQRGRGEVEDDEGDDDDDVFFSDGGDDINELDEEMENILDEFEGELEKDDFVSPVDREDADDYDDDDDDDDELLMDD